MRLLSVPLVTGLSSESVLYMAVKQFLGKVNEWINGGEDTRRDLGVDGRAKTYFMAGW